MFCFGYALVPLYNVFCELTGLNGKTGVISSTEAAALAIDTGRLVTVEFDTNVNDRLSWTFSPAQRMMQVHPGQVTEAIFVVTNTSAGMAAGQAVPSVAPAKASLYFNKTECFCFSRQSLRPGESKRMPVRFVIDPEMPNSINMLTLSYTFFPVAGPQAYGGAGAADLQPDS
jgi:cytochrome c oxidase assembly protein subunit 11